MLDWIKKKMGYIITCKNDVRFDEIEVGEVFAKKGCWKL